MSKQNKTNFANEQQWTLGQAVDVQLCQWIPPLDGDGQWKDTGRGFKGELVNGPDSKLHSDDGRYWYILPEDGGVYGVLAPVQIDGEPFDPYGGVGIVSGEADPKAGTEMLRFTVHAISQSMTRVTIDPTSQG